MTKLTKDQYNELLTQLLEAKEDPKLKNHIKFINVDIANIEEKIRNF